MDERRQGISHMVGIGYSREDAEVIYDLAAHACVQAIEAIERVILTAPTHLLVPTTVVTLGWLSKELEPKAFLSGKRDDQRQV